jgi:hypothetical protein
MGAFWGLKLLPMVSNVTFSGYGFVPLLPYLERTATPMWQELSGVGILQRLGSERASSRPDLTRSESCLLQCQKFRFSGCICAPPELGLTSLGPEVAFFRPRVSSLLAIASMAHTFSVEDVARGPIFAHLAAHVLDLACAPVRVLIIFFVLYPSPCLAPVGALVHHPV